MATNATVRVPDMTWIPMSSSDNRSKSGGGPRTSTQPKPVPDPKKSAGQAGGGKVRVHAGAGDKCVPPAKSRPKKRKAVRDGEDGPGIGMECVEWCDDRYRVAQLVAAFGHQLPVIARVEEGCQSHGGHELSTGQIVQVHSYGKQKRIIASYSKGGQLSIPSDYPMEIYTKDGQTGERWKLQQATDVKKLPLKVQVLSIYEHVEREPPVPLVGEELTILKAEEVLFLRANPITEGWIDQNEVAIIPGSSQATFSIAVGMSGASHAEWEDYFGMFARSVRHLNIVFITGYQGILLQDVPSSVRTSIISQSVPSSPAAAVGAVVYENIQHLQASPASLKVAVNEYQNIPAQRSLSATPERSPSAVKTSDETHSTPHYSSPSASSSSKAVSLSDNSTDVYAEVDKVTKHQPAVEPGTFTTPTLNPIPPAVPTKQFLLDDEKTDLPFGQNLKPISSMQQPSPRSDGRPSTPFSEADEEDLNAMFASVISLAEEQDRLHEERQKSLKRGEATEHTVVVETYNPPPEPTTQSYENHAFTNDEQKVSTRILNNNNTTLDKVKKQPPQIAAKPKRDSTKRDSRSSQISFDSETFPRTGSSSEDPTGKQRINVGRVSSRRKDNLQYTPKAVVQPTVHQRDSRTETDRHSVNNDPNKIPLVRLNSATKEASSSNSPLTESSAEKSGLETMDDVPENLEGLSVADVCQCLSLMNMDAHVTQFRKQQVDGHLLNRMKESDLLDEFKLTPFNASKLMRFVRGWRPKVN